ncbi:hypothetical protein DSL72_002670 [Monilinia vaccinii-corymbosi]|uniref:Uncharacterized protein n=1 Tax=Monilinia vaccinii-corymbosi TaxID=61207 RepID=A0A8A3PDC0_9HELO|nr:hypothetical protein DSL72_002670 [Monilinia vaccinii-corymbosi]
MVYYEQRKPRLVLRNAPPRRTDPPRVVLREQRLETPFPNGNNPTNLPFHMAYLQQPYHGSFQNMAPGNLPYPTFQPQLSVAYNVPLHMNMVPGHLALQTSNTRNHHHNLTVHNGRQHERNGETYAECTSVLGERRDENTGRVSPRVALRTMMQQALRPNVQPEKFGRQTHHNQHSHQPRGSFHSSLREFSMGSDVAICPPLDRSLEARIREQLARSGLLRDCPEPEYVNRPMVADPSIVSCGRAVKQHDPIHHRRPQYIFGQTQPPEDFRFATNRELSRAHFVNNSPLKAQRNTGIPTYKTTTPQSKVQRVQTYRGVDSVVKEPKRRDSLHSYKAEAEPKFLTKDDYSPTKQIIGYWVNSPSGSPKSSKIIPVKSLKNQEETTTKSLRQPVKNRIGGVSEPEKREAAMGDGKVKINKSEDTPKAVVSSINTVDHESPMQIIEIVDKYATNPKEHAHVTAQDVSDEETSESPDHKKTADLLEDCIRSLATWNKGDRKVLHKILKALKSFDDDDGGDDAKPIKNLEISHDTKRSPRKEREQSSSLNPNAECFKDFASASAHDPHTHNGHHERRGLSLQEEVIPTSNEILPVMFYSKPLMPAEPIWIKTQPDSLVRPPPSLVVPFRAHVGRKVPVKTTLKQIPSDEEEGRVAKVMDHRLAEPLLARFHEKYPLTGTLCANPPSPPPAPVKSAAEIQEELERLLLQEKEKKAFAKPSEFAGKLRAPKGPYRVEASKLVK